MRSEFLVQLEYHFHLVVRTYAMMMIMMVMNSNIERELISFQYVTKILQQWQLQMAICEEVWEIKEKINC
jgi:hypothetical protein